MQKEMGMITAWYVALFLAHHWQQCRMGGEWLRDRERKINLCLNCSGIELRLAGKGRMGMSGGTDQTKAETKGGMITWITDRTRRKKWETPFTGYRSLRKCPLLKRASSILFALEVEGGAVTTTGPYFQPAAVSFHRFHRPTQKPHQSDAAFYFMVHYYYFF